MKNAILFVLLSVATNSSYVFAQGTLTVFNSEYRSGFSGVFDAYDTTSVLPRNSGSNQLWDFSSIVDLHSSFTVTTASPSSVPNATDFPNCTSLITKDFDGYDVYQDETIGNLTKVTLVGNIKSGVSYTYATPGLEAVFPITVGDVFSQAFLYTAGQYTLSGSDTIKGIGSGTLVLPGGLKYNDAIAIKKIRTASGYTNAVGPKGLDRNYTFEFYSKSVRGPILIFGNEINTDVGFVDSSNYVSVQRIVGTGITDNFMHQFSIYPNPSIDEVSITSDGNLNKIEITDVLGRACKEFNGIRGDLAFKLPIGVYFIHAVFNDGKILTKKLIVVSQN